MRRARRDVTTLFGAAAALAVTGSFVVVGGCTAVLGDGHYTIDLVEAGGSIDDDAGQGDPGGDAAPSGGPCASELQRCSGKTAQACAPDGQWMTIAKCPYQCTGAGVCSGACATGAKQCAGDGVQVCDATGTWQPSQACSFGCANGACEGTCVPGSAQCSGAAIQTCDSTGTWMTSKTCPFLCTGSGTCSGSCTPNTTQCSGSTPQSCDSTGSWQSQPACVQPAPDCAMGGCTCLGTVCSGVCAETQTDGHNCGACGHDCGGQACQAGQCQPATLASSLSKPWGIALSATHVYWTNTGDGTVMTVPIAGGVAATVLASGQSNPMSIAVDATNVYWAATGGGTVMKCALGGCAGTPTALASALSSPWGIAVDAANAYWTAGGAVSRIALTAATAASAVGSESKTAYPIAVDATSAYWADSVGAVFKCALAGCGSSPTTLSGSVFVGPADGLALDAGNVYWTNSGIGTVNKIAKTGSTSTVLALTQSSPMAIAVDATNVYWANNGDGTIMKIPLGGGTATTVASGQSGPAGLVVDATYVYWTNQTGGTVMRVAK